MRNSFRRYTHYAFALVMFLFAFSPVNGIGGDRLQGTEVMMAKLTPGTPVDKEEHAIFDKNHPAIQAVLAVQDRHARNLMAIPEVVGTATGLTETGKPAIHVYTREAVPIGVIPESIEGLPVVVKVTGKIFAMKGPVAAKVSPTARFDRPVPIGVSTGNEGECSAGTIGARVKKADGTVYALSNNHVYALENDAPTGSKVLQPGRYDTGCASDTANVIGTLYAFVPIDFSGGANRVDAAIALTAKDLLGNATPSNGYGKPQSATASAEINAAVQKYGRTTSWTKGTITAINAIITINYGTSGTATFDKQIVVYSGKPFIKAGDSGSLLVTADIDPDLSRKPVGLLFAGDSSGKYAIANPISDVLNSFDVSVDDGP